MSKSTAFSKRPFLISVVLCYLCLLGYYHLRQSRSVVPEDVLVAEELRRELPEELVEMALKPEKLDTAEPFVKKNRPSTFPKGALPTLAPAHLTGEARFRYYRDQAERLGLQVQGLTVLGFRGLSPRGDRHPSEDNASAYDDTFVILDPHLMRATELLGSTHAGQFTSTLSPGGVAQIKPGLYQANPCGEYAGMPCWLVTTVSGSESVPCRRDANGNGFIDDTEKTGNLFATEILFHNGRYEDYGSSIGCQVLPPPLMETFIGELGQNNAFQYLLVDANRRFR